MKRDLKAICFFEITAFVLNFALGTILYLLNMTKQFETYMMSLIIISVCSVLIPSIIFSRYSGKTESLLKQYDKKIGLADNIFIVISGFLSCTVLNYLCSLLFRNTNSAVEIPDGSANIGLAVIAFAVVPAICEETAFRGFVIGTLAKYGKGIDIIVSAILFSILHKSVSSAVFAFFAGLLLGLVRKISGSLIQSIVIHFLNNLIAVLEIVFIGG